MAESKAFDAQIMELPQMGILAQGKDIYLTVQYSTLALQFYLCNINNYEQIAREVHKSIMDAGVQAKRAASGLVVARGDVDAVVPKPEGRQQRSQSRPRP